MAAPPPAAAEVRAALRALLRAIDRHVTSVAGNTAWRDHAIAQFRAPAPADAAAAREGLALARDYARLVEGIAHHRVRSPGEGPRGRGGPCGGHWLQCWGAGGCSKAKPLAEQRAHVEPSDPRTPHAQQDLLRSYNLGLDPDERNKRMVEATARRVGFALPSEPKPPPRPRKSPMGEGQQQQQEQSQQQQQEQSQQQQQQQQTQQQQQQQQQQTQQGDAAGGEPQRAAG
jgi:hypothetical protein